MGHVQAECQSALDYFGLQYGKSSIDYLPYDEAHESTMQLLFGHIVPLWTVTRIEHRRTMDGAQHTVIQLRCHTY